MNTEAAAEKQTTANANQPLDLAGLCLAFMERAPLPMAAVDGATQTIRYANPAFCAIFARPMEKILGKLISDLLPAKDQSVTLLDQVFRTGRPASHAEQEPSKQPPVFWSYTMWPVLADERLLGVIIQVTETAKFHEKTVAMNEALMLGAVRQHELKEAADRLNAKLELEITQRKHAQQALLEAKAALADEAAHLERLVTERTAALTSSNKQLEAFVYTIAHDLRAPLRSMQGFSDMLVSGEDPKAAVDYAQRICTSARLMDAMLTDLLAFSCISQEKLDLGPVHLETSVRAALASLETDIQKANGRVEAAGPWPTVLAHGPTLSQVLFNLVSNALKFVRPGVPPQIRIRAEELPAPQIQQSTDPTIQPSLVRVWVEDNGIGIAPEHQEQIFRLFLRLHRNDYEGTGVGLAIVQKAIERMGGRIGVDSHPGHGSRFWFDLRKAPDPSIQ